MAKGVVEGECPPEEGIPAEVPPLLVRRLPAPAAPAGFAFPFQSLLDIFRDIFAFIRGGSPVYIKPASRSEIQQYTIVDVKVQRLTTIPADALEWELWNSDLGSATGSLDWGYVSDFGTTGTGQFNRLAFNDRVARSVAGVDLYIRVASANQVIVLEVLRP